MLNNCGNTVPFSSAAKRCLKLLCLLSAFFCASTVFAQAEICDNGIDDNGNGLIDLNDTAACSCKPQAASLIPNASFEEKNACPTFHSQLSYAQSWVQASSATSDYFNTCGYIFSSATNAGLVPPPDGNGFAGFISSHNYKEYIGTCLPSPLKADSSYSFQLSIASAPIDPFGGVCNGGVINYTPSYIAIYGSQNCSTNLPFVGLNCPPATWVILDSVLYTPVASWGTITFNFTPSVDMDGIMIGSPCALPPSYAGNNPCNPYFYVDNFQLNKTDLTITISQTGNWCDNTNVLTGDTITGATYQWYKEGVAIVGQTSNILNVSALNLPVGKYSLGVTLNGVCTYTSVNVVQYNYPPTVSNAGPFCSYDGDAYLIANPAGGIWSGPGITDSLNGVFTPSAQVVGSNVITYTLPSSGLCIKTDSIVIMVNAPPNAFAGNDTTVCAGIPFSVGAANVPTYSYQWTPMTGLANPFTSPTNLTLTNNDTEPSIANYSLIVTDNATGCQALDQIAFTVNPTPVITPVGPFCNSDADVTLSATLPGGTWAGTGITNTSTGIFSPAAATVGSNTITYSISGGCAVGDTLIIDVSTPPAANAGADIAICSGDSAVIGSPAVQGYTYAWQPFFGLTNPNDAQPGITQVNNSNGPVGSDYVLTVSAGSCSSKDTVNVILNPRPSLEISNPASVCSPATVDITNPLVTIGSTGGGTLSYWIDSLATIPLTNPAAVAIPGTYYIKASAGTCIDIDSVVVQIGSGAAVADAGTDAVICTGDTVQLGAASVMGNTYSWSPATNLSDPAIANPVATLTNSGTSPQTQVFVLTVSGVNCSAYDTVEILVNPLATANASNDIAICAGSNVTLSGTIGGSATSAVWSGGGLFTPSANDLNASYTPDATEISAGTAILILTTDDPLGNCTAATDTLMITINSPATVNVGLDDTICAGATVPLNAVVSGATSGTWSNGQGSYTPSDTVATAVYTPSFAENESGIATLIFTANALSGACPAASDTFVITINQAPIVNAGTNQNLCTGVPVNLNGMVGGLATTATWSGGSGTFVPNNTTLNASYIPASADYAADSVVLTLTPDATMGLNCPAVSSQIIVYFNQKPQIAFTVNDSAGCPEHCVSFTNATTVSGGTVTAWLWNFGDNSPLDTTQNPTHCYTQPADYDVSLIALSDDNCADTLSIPQMIHVHPLPTAGFEFLPEEATLSNTLISLHSLSSSDVTQWYWAFGDGDSIMATIPDTVHLFPDSVATTYTTYLVVQNAYGCADTVSRQIVINSEFNFYIPNAFTPANPDGINDVFAGKGNGIDEYQLMVFDRWGNLIFVADDIAKGWDGKVNDGTELAQMDIYVWKVKITDVFKKKHTYTGIVTLVK